MQRRRFLELVGGATASAFAGCNATRQHAPTSTPDAENGRGCPALSGVDRTICAASRSGPLSVERSAERVAGPEWTLQVTVTNQSSTIFGTNQLSWSVIRTETAAPIRVSPMVGPEPWIELRPGSSYRWVLSTSDQPAVDADQQVLLELESGRFAFVIPFEGPSRIATIARFARDP